MYIYIYTQEMIMESYVHVYSGSAIQSCTKCDMENLRKGVRGRPCRLCGGRCNCRTACRVRSAYSPHPLEHNCS